MSRLLVFAIVFAGLGLVATDRALAQGRYGSSDNPVGPTVSPYLNLLSADQFGITNYQSLVRPLVQQGNAINRQGSSLSNLQRQVNSSRQSPNGGATGHATFFMNYSHFYPPPAAR